MRAWILAALLACASSPKPVAQPAPALLSPSVKDISAELEPIRVKGKLPALAGAAFRGGELVAIGAAGFQKEGSDVRITTDARWHLGSDTKAMTAVLVAIEIDREKLHFDDTLGAIFGSGVNAALANVTVEQLLEHRGGFSKDLSPELMQMLWREPRSKFVETVLAAQPAHAPGTFEYSNTSYIVLGAALEKVTGKTWEDSMRADLFAPLGMTRCGFGAPDGPDAPWGHRKDTSSLVPVPPGPLADNAPTLGPAGRVHCALADWGKFLNVVLAGMRSEKTIASAATMKRLLTPPSDAKEHERYAGGWMFLERDWANGTTLTHTGSNTMWTATAWLAPEKDLAFVAATNVFAPRELDAAFGPLVGGFAK